MTTGNWAISQRENYSPSGFTRFLWWLSTAEKEILIDSVIDRNRYRIIGMSVLATWAFASLAWTYFFFTLVDSMLPAILPGIFMGFIILTIDRALIKGITKFNKRKFIPLLFRGLLALTIGTFMAQPAVLYMFDKEIKLQTSLDNEKKKQLKRSQLDLLYKNQMEELATREKSIQQNLNAKYEAVSKARENFLAESDGSGGTGRIGMKEIALAKKNEYQKLDDQYQSFAREEQIKLDSINKTQGELENIKKKEEADFATYLNNGFLTRVEALENILKGNTALQFRYYLIVFILMLIELMPVIAKTMLPSGSYDEKVMFREELEIVIAQKNIRKEQLLKELYTEMAYDNDAEAINSFFTLTRDSRNEKISAFGKKWATEQHTTFDGLWEQMKKEILSKQEY